MSHPFDCNDCAGLTSGRCWRHAESVIQMLANLNHVHEWRVAGQLANAAVLLVCPHHDPPETRTVQP